MGLEKRWCGSVWGWIQCWISLWAQQLQIIRQEGRLRDGKAEGWETSAQKHSACAGVSCCCGCTCQASHRGYWVINLWQKAELPSHSQQILNSLLLPSMGVSQDCKRSNSFSSAPSGVFPSEPEFIPLFKFTPLMLKGSVRFSAENLQSQEVTNRWHFDKEGKYVPWKKGRGTLDPEFNRASVWPGCEAWTSWETQTHLALMRTKSQSQVFYCLPRPTSMPDETSKPLCQLTVLRNHHQDIQTSPLRSETAEELNHRASVPSFYAQSQHRKMWPGFQKNSTAWRLC